MNDVVQRVCPFCGTDNRARSASPYGDASWPLKVCGHCGFAYLELTPVYERLSEEFAWEKTSTAETRRRFEREPLLHSLSAALKTFRQRWLKRDKLGDLIRRYVPPGQVLDVGCGEGGALERLSEQYVPCGVEVSRVLAERANARVARRGGRVIHDAAVPGMKQFAAQSFTGVLLSSFLEHEVQPRPLLLEVARTLAPGGVCIIKVPNYGSWNRRVRGARWCGFRLPDHVNYFTPASLTQMCRDAGLAVVRFRPWDRLPTSDNMWMVVRRAA